MFHSKIKSRHFERVGEPLFFPLFFFSLKLFFLHFYAKSFLQPHLLHLSPPVSFPPFASLSFIHPERCTQHWCDALSYIIHSEWLSSISKDPKREEKQAYGLPRLSKVEAQFSSCWSAFQGILFPNSLKSSNSEGGEGGECRGTRGRSTIYGIRKVKRNCQARGLNNNTKKPLTTGVTSRKTLKAAG